MYKLEIPKGQKNANKLHDEIGQLELDYFLTHDDNSIFLSFPDIKREEIEGENEEVIVTYKRRVESIITEEVEGELVEKIVEEWIDYDFSVIEIIINDKIANHDPTPYPEPISELDLLREQIAQQQEIIDAMLNGGGQ